MEMSVIGKQALIAREGRRLEAYRDSVGVPTIGIGVTTIDGKPVKMGMKITAAECDALFEKTLARYVAAVNRGLKVEVPQHAFDALGSICYNIGIGTENPKKGQKPGFLGSTFLKRINDRSHPDVIQANILSWDKPAEIIPRRKAEALQFRTPYAVEMPRQVNTSKPLKIAATVSEALSPAVPTPVIVPVVAPPAVTKPLTWWERLGRAIDAAFG